MPTGAVLDASEAYMVLGADGASARWKKKAEDTGIAEAPDPFIGAQVAPASVDLKKPFLAGLLTTSS